MDLSNWEGFKKYEFLDSSVNAGFLVHLDLVATWHENSSLMFYVDKICVGTEF